jgi:glutamate N-acetyltransferase/amino-acid N-acetyltransferase
MTSDTRRKEVAVEFKLRGKTVRLGGICKGAGMIQPGMSASGARPAARSLHATMLSFITTDAAIVPRALQGALSEAVAASFNRITVDGDMSTNDTVLALANGAAGNSALRTGAGPRREAARDHGAFQAALAAKEFDLHINLNLGSAKALIYAADLTEEYVAFNKGDVSDPTSLGA